MKKILHISTPKSWRGGEQQLAYLIENTSTNLKHTVLCPLDAELGKKGFYKDIDFEYFEKKGLGARIAKAVKLLRSHSFDLIHTHDSKAHTIALLALIISKLNIPLVVSRRVDFPIGRNGLSKWKYDHPKVSAILCVSETIKKICEPSLKRNRSKLQTVHSGVDASKLTEASGTIRNELGINNTTWMVGCVAALAPHKDHLCLLNAWVEFKADRDAHLVLVGEGGEREKIENFIQQNKLECSVSLVGYRSDVHQILPDFDAFAISSSTEGLGTSIIDAMFAKLPVVATEAGGIPELVKHKVNGLLCPPKNHGQFSNNLKELYENKETALEMGKKGFELAQNFTAGAMARKTEEVYNSLFR